MKDADCIHFLQWALPRLGLRWAGFRRVRGQVCKRLRRRLAALSLKDLSDYRALLAADPAQWRQLDDLCRVSVSRFYRDQGVWRCLERELLPQLAAQASVRNAVSLGGDADMACIVGGIAQGFYGSVPEPIADEVRTRLPEGFLEVLDRFEYRYGSAIAVSDGR